MKTYLLILTAAAASILVATQANAAQVGTTMTYATSAVISGLADGTGAGSGIGVFDSSGALTIESQTSYDIPAFAAMGTTTDTTVLYGSIAGTTWTGDGTGLATLHSCVGSPLICGGLTVGSQPITPSVFSLDIDAGGAWDRVTLLMDGAVSIAYTETLTPQVVPLPAALWLFGSAVLGLLGIGGKRSRASGLVTIRGESHEKVSIDSM